MTLVDWLLVLRLFRPQVPAATSRSAVKKIVVIGSGGAGKSILVREMSRILGINVIHLDALFWKPGWVKTSKGKWEETQKKLVQQDNWIIDGNYGGTMDIRLEAADAIVFLDMSRVRCVWQVVKRVLQYRGRTRPDLADGCPEQLPSREFLQWIWNYPKERRPQILQKLEEYGKTREVFVLHTPRQVRSFLKTLKDRS